jgi:hypothetical protein
LNCSNGGNVSGTTENCTCKCADGYSGTLCETVDAVDACAGSSLVCANGWTTDGTGGDCKCVCAGGFDGPTCASQPCANVLICENGGFFSNRQGDCKCFCRPGFSGPTCTTQDRDPCFWNVRYCSNGGVINTTECACECAEGFSGPKCDTVDPVTSPPPTTISAPTSSPTASASGGDSAADVPASSASGQVGPPSTESLVNPASSRSPYTTPSPDQNVEEEDAVLEGATFTEANGATDSAPASTGTTSTAKSGEASGRNPAGKYSGGIVAAAVLVFLLVFGMVAFVGVRHCRASGKHAGQSSEANAKTGVGQAKGGQEGTMQVATATSCSTLFLVPMAGSNGDGDGHVVVPADVICAPTATAATSPVAQHGPLERQLLGVPTPAPLSVLAPVLVLEPPPQVALFANPLYDGAEPHAPPTYSLPHDAVDAARIRSFDASSHSNESPARHSTDTSGDVGGSCVPLGRHKTYTDGSFAPQDAEA